MGTPSIYVYDCSNAGVIVDLFKQFAEQHEKEFEVRYQFPTFRNFHEQVLAKQNRKLLSASYRSELASSRNNLHVQKLYSVGCMQCRSDSTHEPRLTRRYFYFLSNDANQNCAKMVNSFFAFFKLINCDLVCVVYLEDFYRFVMQDSSKLVPKINLDLIDK